VILAVACAAGFALAWASGADPRELTAVRLRWTTLVLGALALQLVIFAAGIRLPGPLAGDRVTHVVSYVLLLAFAIWNARTPGFALAAAGLASNAVVIFLNGGRMPVSARAWAESTARPIRSLHDGVYNNIALVHPGSHLAFLGDIFALPRVIPLANTFSVGDVLLLAGAALFVYRAGRQERDRPPVRASAPLRNAEFRSLLAGRTISKLGDWISIAALVTWIYSRTHSTTAVSALLLARLLASIAGGLVGGAVLDRFGRFQTLRAIEAARALATTAAIAAVASGHTFAVAACVFVSSFLAAATDPTASSLIADILPPDTRHAGNALHAVARATVMAAGAMAGGVVAAAIGAVPALAGDTATFAIAFALYWRSARHTGFPRPPAVSRRATHARANASRLEALGVILRSRSLSALVAAFALATLAMGMLNASLPAFLAGHASDAGGYGVAIGMIGLGLMCGEFLSGRVAARLVDRAPALGFALSAGVLAVAAASHLPTTILLLLFLLGMSDGATETAYDTLVQNHTPRRLSARVFALAGSIQQAGMVAGFLLAPVLQQTAPNAAFPASSLALGASALIATIVIARPGKLKRNAILPVPLADQHET
jgi:MFS family permease